MIHLLYNFLSYPFVALRNQLYNQGFIKPIKTNIPIISVGNISFGGTGKTPFITYLTNKLNELGIKSLLLSRGYKGSLKDVDVLSDVDSFDDLYKFGDEAFLVHLKTNIPILIAKKKYKAANLIDNLFDVNVVILDDGFQHRKLQRNLDIVLIDLRTFKTFRREPFSSIKRANIILLEDGISPTRIPSGPYKIFYYRKVINGFESFLNTKVELKSFSGQKIALLSAIGNNDNFYKSLQLFSLIIVKHYQFRDHHWYTQKEVIKICEKLTKLNIHTLITTEKDSIKLRRFTQIFEKFNVNLISAVLELKIEEENALLETVLAYINSKVR
ncbi:MAG: tetraacyldisaccharide 4'-kinase [Candidatus Kapaibacteriota bacterium]